MKYAPSVSAVIPLYNRSNQVVEAVASVLSQDGERSGVDELIVVDDGSTDGGTEAIGRLYTDESRIRIVTIGHSGFPGFVRNRGAEVARGDLLAFLDSDDLWLTGKIDAQREIHRIHPEIGLSHTRERWLRGDREVSQKSQRHLREGDIFADALEKCIIGPSTVMMDRRLFEETGGFAEDIEIAEDYEYWLRITDRYPVAYLDAPYTVKRAGHGDQLSEKYGHIEWFRIQALHRLLETYRFSSDEHRIAAAVELERKCGIYAAGARKRGNDEEADRILALLQR